MSRSQQPVPAPTTPPWAAIVLAGGTSRRWEGWDKTAVDLAGRPVLCHPIAAALPEARIVVVVAPRDHPAAPMIRHMVWRVGRELLWTREDPPGGGPAAALAAAVTALNRTATAPERVVVLAGDLPFAGPAIGRLLTALNRPLDHPAGRCDPTDSDDGWFEAAQASDPEGHRQPLLAAYRSSALHSRLRGGADGLSMRSVLSGLRVTPVPVSAREAMDLDTPQALAQAAAFLATDPAPTHPAHPVPTHPAPVCFPLVSGPMTAGGTRCQQRNEPATERSISGYD